MYMMKNAVSIVLIALLLTTGCDQPLSNDLYDDTQSSYVAETYTPVSIEYDYINTESVFVDEEPAIPILHTDNEDNLYHITSSKGSKISPQRGLEIVSELFPNAPILELDYHWHTYGDDGTTILRIEFAETDGMKYEAVSFDTSTGECMLHYKCGCCMEITDEPYELYIRNDGDIYNINTVCPDGNISMQKALEIVKSSRYDMTISDIGFRDEPMDGMEKYWYVEISGDIYEDGWIRQGCIFVDAITGELVYGIYQS